MNKLTADGRKQESNGRSSKVIEFIRNNPLPETNDTGGDAEKKE